MIKYILALALLAGAPLFAYAHPEDYDNYYALPMMGWNGNMHWGGWITMVLIWLFLLVAILAMLKWIDKNK